MSLFSGSGRIRRNLRQKVVHSSGESDTEDNRREHQSQENEGALSFAHQEFEDDVCEVTLKKPDHSVCSKDSRKKLTREKKQKIQNEIKIKEVTPLISEGVIPSAAAIHAARKKREMARSVGENIIEVKKKLSDIASDDNSDEESHTIRQFGVSQSASKQIEVLSALDNATSGSDEERFIEEQIGKGIYTCLPVNEKSKQVEELTDNLPVSSLPLASVPVSVVSILSQLNHQLDLLRESHSSNSSMVGKLSNDILTAHSAISLIEKQSATLSVNYQFFQETKGYVKDLLLCLTAKVPEIKNAGNEFLDILKGKSELLINRRRQDLIDMVDVCNNSDMDEAKHSRIVEREGRSRRRRLRSNRSSSLLFEGLSSDDELLPSAESKISADIEKVTSRQDVIFGDVNDEFSKLQNVLDYFCEWKSSFLSSYESAYISYCLPKLLAPYVSHHLLFWNPLDSSNQAYLLDMPFFQTLLLYEIKMNPDILFVPQIVELAVLPKLIDLVKNVWDPMSSTQSCLLKTCIHSILTTFPTILTSCETFNSLFDEIVAKFDGAINKDAFIPMYSQDVLADESTRQSKFSQTQFWRCFKLLKNILFFDGFIDVNHLQRLAADGLINRYLLLSLQNSPRDELSLTKVERVEVDENKEFTKIVDLLPSEWLKDKEFSRHLANLRRYFSNFSLILQNSVSKESGYQENIESLLSRSTRLAGRLCMNLF